MGTSAAPSGGDRVRLAGYPRWRLFPTFATGTGQGSGGGGGMKGERFSEAPLTETERIPSLAAIVLWEPRIERHRTAPAARLGPPQI